MAAPAPTDFLAGVIEGFYGQPWTQAERFELFEWMAGWGLNTYFYGPKDDWKHRAIWRETYSPDEAASLGELIRACRERRIRFIYALSPGLDIRYAGDVDLDHLRNRFAQMIELGCSHFALLFDDIPDRLDEAALERWGSLAAAQARVANALADWTRERLPHGRFLFCPTPYCGRMAAAGLGGPGYLEILGRELAPRIDILWTGPEIISREITVDHLEDLRRILRRPPVIWDNLHANDYDGRRFYCGPCAGRDPGLRQSARGLLSNPNTEFALNYVPIRTLARFVHESGDWNPREAYLSAMGEWASHFATCGRPIPFEDLVLLGDCYYLPYEEGPEAVALHGRLRDLLARPPAGWGDEAVAFRRDAGRLREVCARMTELRRRPLFHALSRRVWELREEMDLLERYVAFHSTNPDPNRRWGSDFHLPETYRGGMVARLQRLLLQLPNGDFVPAPPAP